MVSKMTEQERQDLEKAEAEAKAKLEASKNEDPAKLKAALEDFKTDMFKYKDQLKETQQELTRIKEEKAAKERDQLEKNQEWKTLYEKEKEQRVKLNNELTEKSDKFVKSSKINAVVQKLGGFKKDSYSKFIDADKVLTDPDTGQIIEDSLLAEVDRVKQNYPELLKNIKNVTLPDGAPQGNANNGKKSLKQMSKDELLAEYRKLNKK